MQSKFYLASFIACFLSLNSFAQKKQNVYFLKNDGQYLTESDSADFTRIVQEPDSGSVLYNVLDYYPSGNLKMRGKSSAIDPIKLEGQNISFYPNKNKKQVCIYEKGIPTGEIYNYYPNGKMFMVSYYRNTVNKNAHVPFNPDQIIQTVYDSTGVEIVKNGNGHYKIFDQNFKSVEEEGDLKDGKRDGIWKGTLNKQSVTYAEEYADGKFVKGTRTNEDGSTINYTVKETLPTFKGGGNVFGNYLSFNIHYPPVPREKGIQGIVAVGFVVETDGSLTNIRVLKSVYPDLDAEALRVIRQSPKWNPGLQHGVPVKVAYAMPINFTLQGK